MDKTRHGHRTTRREFLRTHAALAAGLGAGALFGGYTVPTSAATPPKTLTLGLDQVVYGLNDSWLPSRTSSVSTNPRATVYDHLLLVDAKDQYKALPGLAASWTNKGAQEYTFTIRRGVKWQKGYGDVTADDVAFSLKSITGADSKAIDGAYWRDRVGNMRVVDPYTLAFSFETIEPDLISMLSAQSHQVILCQKYVEQVGEDRADVQPVGSGPYQLDSQVPSAEVTLVPSGPTHWRVTPKWGKIHAVCLREETTRLALMESGRADIVTLAMTQIDEARNHGYRIMPSDTYYLYAIDFGGLFPKGYPLYTGKEPWQDIRVREAMNIAIDRAAINKTFFAGLGVIDNVMGNAVAPAATTTARMSIPYDPARAKALLKAAGYEQGFEVPIVSYDIASVPNANVIQVVAAAWQAIGLQPRIQPSDFAAFRSRLLKNETNGLMYGWANDLRASFQSRFQKFFYSKSGGFGIYYDAHLDSVYETLMKTPDAHQRDKMLADTMVYLRKQWAAVPIVSIPQAVFAVNPKTVGLWSPVWRNTADNFEYVQPA